MPIRHSFILIIFLIFPLIPSSYSYSQDSLNAIRIINASKEMAQVKLIGQTNRIMEIEPGAAKDLKIRSGDYSIFIRFANPPNKYDYYKCKSFSADSSTLRSLANKIRMINGYVYGIPTAVITKEEYNSVKVPKMSKSLVGNETLSIGKCVIKNKHAYTRGKEYNALINKSGDADTMVFSGVVVTQIDGIKKTVGNLVLFFFFINSENNLMTTIGVGDSGKAGIGNIKTITESDGSFKFITGNICPYYERATIGWIVHKDPNKPFDILIYPISFKENKVYEIQLEPDEREVKLGEIDLLIDIKFGKSE